MSKNDANETFIVHAVCIYLRRGMKSERCLECPARVETPYGPGTQGCYLLAQEVINIARHGNPWGADAAPEHVERWRQHHNDE